MSGPSGAKVGDLIDFKWGTQTGAGVKNKDVRFYESFVYEGVEYFLYDCAYFYLDHHFETSVGKLVKMYERPTHEKVLKVVWFFRPSEVRNFLGDYQPRWNELFLASGAGKGLSNITPLESIIRKCNVVCTSRDKRNTEPSEIELKTADFFFNCAFDVGRRAILDNFPDVIGGIEVTSFFNRKQESNPSKPLQARTKTRPKTLINTRSDPSGMLCQQIEHNAEVRTSENVVPKSSSDAFPYKKRKVEDENPTLSPSREFPMEKELDEKGEKLRQDKGVNRCRKITEVTKGPNADAERSLHSFPYKKRKLGDEKLVTNRRSDPGKINRSLSISQPNKSLKDKEFDEEVAKVRQDESRVKTPAGVIEVTERPDAERRRWFKKEHWDQRLREAQEMGTLVLLSNLDPSFSSIDVENIVWSALQKKVDARLIEQRVKSNDYYGRALVIFKTEDAAQYAMSELNRRCLVLEDGRVVRARKGTITEPNKQRKFHGHLTIDRIPPERLRPEMRNAVSTSHCAQGNTIEYEMASDWLLQYKKYDVSWEALSKKQRKEIEDVKNKLKLDRIFGETS
ncbi:protein ANTI-SILENCING 1 isoform X2 [Arachis ipaensis]|uniref:protein ANTI-SILENCING 1 isoform X2 n=1 Tax=Arachis ipaensis TaxID=130454 RepID=UPI000A2B7AB5|nr:protein ANTI-SILENCING 1 isoform X2 [Arachis ipaensis]